MTKKTFKKIYYLFFLLTIIICDSSCSSKITVKPASKFRKEASFNFFSSYYKGFSLNTYNYLNSNSLMNVYQKDPIKLINILEKRFFQENNNPAILELLANICYLQGIKNHKHEDLAASYFLSSAMYSYFYFLYFDPSSECNYDMAKFFVAHYYNRSVQEIFRYIQNKNLLFHDTYPLETITGHRITFKNPVFKLAYQLKNFKKFLICSDYETKNLDYFSYRPGIGVPLIAELKEQESFDLVREISGQAIPSTLILHFQYNKSQNECFSHFEFLDSYQKDNITINKHTFPLEYDFSTPLAYHLTHTPDLNNFYYTLNPEKAKKIQGLYLLEPYDPNKIPVIFIHGILSNPRRWSQMTNTLKTDPEIRKHYQFWMFAYSAGWPIIFSGHLLRQAIQECHNKYHANSQNDEKFKQMILVGHSMGGLISKLQVIDSNDGILDDIFTQEELKNFDQNLSLQQKETIKNIFFFKPSPYVQRIVFLATPHQGSQIANWSIVRWTRKLIKLPQQIFTFGQSAIGIQQNTIENYTGIADLDPNNKTLEILHALKRKPIAYHSIIGNKKKAIPGGSDGIVAYSSSHLDFTESEYIVKSGHSVQQNPLAIQELRRILLQNLNNLNLLKKYSWDFFNE